MTTRRFRVLIEYDPESRLWVTFVPALNNLSTYGQTRDEALAQTSDAIVGYLETAASEGIPVRDDETLSEIVDLEVRVA